MPITVPGNPFGADVRVGTTVPVGLHSAPEAQNSASKAFQSLVADADKLFTQWQEQVDKTRVIDMTNDLESYRMDLRDNLETGYTRLKGKNALERPNGVSLREEIGGKLKERYDELRKNATPRQRLMLESVYKNMSAKNDAEVSRYLVGEFESYQAATEQNTLKLAAQKAMSEDQADAAEGLIAVKALTAQIAARNGIPYDASATMGKIHSMQVGHRLDAGDVAGARAYFEANKDDMDALSRDRAGESIKRGERQLQQESEYQRIVSSYADDRSAGLAEARKAPTEYRSSLVASVRSFYEDKARAEREDVAERESRAYEYILQTGAMPPATMLDGLSAKTIMSMESRVRTRSNSSARTNDRALRARKETPVDQAIKEGVYGVTSIAEWTDSNSYEALAARVERLPIINQSWHVSKQQVLSSSEVTSLKVALSGSDPLTQGRMLARLASSVADSHEDGFDATRVLADQLGEWASPFLLAADATTASLDAPRLYAVGRTALKEKRPNVSNLSNATIGIPAYASELDGIYDDPTTREIVLDCVENVAAGLSVERGAYAGKKDIERAFEIVVGKIYPYNGGKVALRGGLDLDDVETTVRAAKKRLAGSSSEVARLPNGRRITGDELSKILPTARFIPSNTGRDNVFSVVAGETLILNIDGSPYEVEVGK